MHSFEISPDENATQHIKESVTMTSIIHKEGHKSDDSDYADARQYYNRVVLALKLSIAKRNNENSVFFQSPIKTYNKSAGVWYRKEPLGKFACFGFIYLFNSRIEITIIL